MNAKTHTLNVHGQTVRTRTPRRFIVVAVRPKDVTTEDGRTYVAFAEVIKRTDNHKTAKATMNRFGFALGAFATIVDTQEVGA